MCVESGWGQGAGEGVTVVYYCIFFSNQIKVLILLLLVVSCDARTMQMLHASMLSKETDVGKK